MGKFPTEKILPIKIEKYLESQYVDGSGKPVHIYDYEVKAVHCKTGELLDFAKLVPEGTEAVVEYQHLMCSVPRRENYKDSNEFIQHHQMGLALILKKEEQKE